MALRVAFVNPEIMLQMEALPQTSSIILLLENCVICFYNCSFYNFYKFYNLFHWESTERVCWFMIHTSSCLYQLWCFRVACMDANMLWIKRNLLFIDIFKTFLHGLTALMANFFTYKKNPSLCVAKRETYRGDPHY